jgi:diguanylate cyclase (GGDEF)-like protein
LPEQKLFHLLIAADALALIADTFMWLLDGVPGQHSYYLNVTFTLIYYIINPLFCMIWYLYVAYYIYKDIKMLRRRIFVMAPPELAIIVMSFLSLKNGMLFRIDESNIYQRGDLFLVMAGVCLFYLVYAFGLTLRKQRMVDKHDFIPILTFMIPPVVGGVLQTLFYGLSIIWPFVTISILSIYITVQNNSLNTDYLTGLFNRRKLDNYLASRFQALGNNKLAGFMIDVDSFKLINDTYGHSIGDQALINTADILHKTFRKNDLIARYGGDEFVVLMVVRDCAEAEAAISRLEENVARFNEQKSVPYELKLSVGYDCIFEGSPIGVDCLLDHIDKLMYRSRSGSQVTAGINR